MICSNCGKTILDSSSFCPFCGVQNAAKAAPAQDQTPPPPPQQAPDQGAYNQQPYAPPVYGQYNTYAPPAPVAPETNKPRSAYQAALLHLIAGVLGLGYYYRGMQEKAKNCIIMLIVGAVLTPVFGLGAIVIAVCEILNVIEAVKLFKGDITTDAYGRTLYQEF